jgi:hypothetical protein
MDIGSTNMHVNARNVEIRIEQFPRWKEKLLD